MRDVEVIIRPKSGIEVQIHLLYFKLSATWFHSGFNSIPLLLWNRTFLSLSVR